jgi:hypothetical protein
MGPISFHDTSVPILLEGSTPAATHKSLAIIYESPATILLSVNKFELASSDPIILMVPILTPPTKSPPVAFADKTGPVAPPTTRPPVIITLPSAEAESAGPVAPPMTSPADVTRLPSALVLKEPTVVLLSSSILMVLELTNKLRA